MKCKAITSKGTRCKNKAVDGSDYCHIPSHQAEGNNEQKSTKSRNDKGLNKVKLKAIDLLVTGEVTKTDIAKECGIDRGTLYNWLEDEQFQEEYKIRLEEIRDKFSPKLTNLIEGVMESINIRRFEDEKDKVNSLEKLFKVMQLLEGKATDIIDNRHSGEMKFEDVSKLTDEELLEEAKRYGVKIE